jgi:SAM-dependent methyltransferase
MGKGCTEKAGTGRLTSRRRLKSRRREIELFLRSTGFDRTEPQPATWDRFRDLFPASEVDELDAAIAAHAEDPVGVLAPYELMWRTPEWARETYGWLAPITIAWLAWLTTVELQAERILDLGCGPGIHTCFLARRFPEAEIVGTDISHVGLDVGTDLARQMGLANVRFVKADLEGLQPTDVGGQADLVLASTLLADVYPESFGFLDPPDPWSTTASADSLVRHGSVPGTKAIAALLNSGGTYIGLERAPGALSYANWLGALAQSGLCPIVSKATHLEFRMFGQAERLRLLVASHNEHSSLDPAELTTLVRSQYPSEFTVEDELTADPPQERLWGVEMHIVDVWGSGRTRIQYLRLSSGRTVRFESTTRGYRQLQTVTGDLAIRIEYDRTWVSSLPETDPTVVAVLDLQDPV